MSTNIDNINEQDENYVSLKMLKSNIKDALKKSGVLCSVKAQVRREFINNLVPGGGLVSGEAASQLGAQELLFRCAVFHFLRAQKCDYTLSVYTAECGVAAREMLSEAEVAAKLHLGESRSGPASGSGGSSPLEVVMKELSRRTEAVCVEAGTQSDYSGTGIREMLDSRMSDIARTYESKKEQERLFPSRGIEEKMLAFQRDCEKKMQEDLASQLSSMRDVELARVRLEEAHKARLELEAVRTELEQSFERRMLAQAGREADSLRAAADRERSLQQAQFEARQRLQRELDDLRAREQNVSKKAELDTHGLAVFESRLKESQIALESREREVGRREREAEHATRDATERAREEARGRLAEELAALIRERGGLKTERSRLDAERADWDEVVADAAQWRSRCTELQSAVANRDEEIISLKHRIARLDFRQKLEIIEIAELTGMQPPASEGGEGGGGAGPAADPFSSATKQARTQHLLGLMQTNAELGARSKLLEELEKESKIALVREREFRHQLESQLREKQEELDRVVAFSKDFTGRVENERRRGQKEIEKLKRACAVEKGRVVVATNQRAEMESLVHEQRDAIQQLQKTRKTLAGARARGRDDAEAEPAARAKAPASAHKLQETIASEQEWLRQRREVIESSIDHSSTGTFTPPSAGAGAGAGSGGQGGSYIYGHEGVAARASPLEEPEGPSPAVLESRRQLADLRREEGRMRKEYEDIEHAKHEAELKRAKDMLRKQKEENELEELRRSSEEFAEKLRQRKDEEQVLRLREEEEELSRQRAAEDDRRAEDALRVSADRAKATDAAAAAAEKERAQRAEEAGRASELLEQRQREEKTALEKASRDREVAEAAAAVAEAEKQEAAASIALAKLEQDRQAAELLREKEDEVSVSSQSTSESIGRQAPRESEGAGAVPTSEDDHSASRLLDKFRHEDEEGAAREEQKAAGDLAAAQAKQRESERLAEAEEEEAEERRLSELAAEEGRRKADEDKALREATASAAAEKAEKEKKKKEEEETEAAEVEARRKAAQEKSIAAKEEADRQRRVADEEQREADKVVSEAAEAEQREKDKRAAEAEQRRLADEEEEEEERRKEAAGRAAEEEESKKKEGDASALQAARAKVLARRKQKQERDSLESLASEGVQSVRNSLSAAPSAAGEGAAAAVPKPEENMSIIVSLVFVIMRFSGYCTSNAPILILLFIICLFSQSEIEVEKPLEHSTSDDDIWF
jgi:hypothetical protein